MILFESFLIALSTYSAIPVPQFEWNERNMKYAICFFPAVGVLCGGLLFGWGALCCTIGISDLFFAAVAVCIPLLVTGGIHMDGYMDTVDALASHQMRERKLEILKDPHCGAFSVIYCIVYILINLALAYELSEFIYIVCPMFVFSRALSAVCAVNMPRARKNGMLNAYTENIKKKKVNTAMITVAASSGMLMICFSPIAGSIAVCFGLISMLAYCKSVRKHFGGVTGDTAGFFLQICELFCMAGAYIGVLIK